MAGLLPHLRRQRSPVAWDAVSFTPGEHPWWNLAYALVPLLEPNLSEAEHVKQAGVLQEALLQRNGALAGTVRRALELSQGTNRLLLIVDQLEELFTLAPTSAERDEFLEDLLNGPNSAPVTIRPDPASRLLWIRLKRPPQTGRGINDGQIAVGRTQPEELRQAITGPAERVGLEFEPGLVNRILIDVGDEPGNLALLEYALKRLRDQRNGNTITAAAYDSFRGLAGAISDKPNGRPFDVDGPPQHPP